MMKSRPCAQCRTAQKKLFCQACEDRMPAEVRSSVNNLFKMGAFQSALACGRAALEIADLEEPRLRPAPGLRMARGGA
jgi:hypothetical protein